MSFSKYVVGAIALCCMIGALPAPASASIGETAAERAKREAEIMALIGGTTVQKQENIGGSGWSDVVMEVTSQGAVTSTPTTSTTITSSPSPTQSTTNTTVLNEKLAAAEAQFSKDYAAAKTAGLDTSSLVAKFETETAGIKAQLQGQISGTVTTAANTAVGAAVDKLNGQLSEYTGQLTTLNGGFETGLADMKAKVAAGLATTGDLSKYIAEYEAKKEGIQEQIAGVKTQLESQAKSVVAGAVTNLTSQATGALTTAANNAIGKAAGSLGLDKLLGGQCGSGYVTEGGLTACGTKVPIGDLISKLLSSATTAATTAATGAITSAVGSL